MQNLFDKIPESLFSPLTSRYKSVYSYCLISLYRLFRTYKQDINKSDYVDLLKNEGEDILSLINIQASEIENEIKKGDFDNTSILNNEAKKEDNIEVNNPNDINDKINYIIRNLSSNGWFIITKVPGSKAEKILIPAYSFKFLKLLNDLVIDSSSYLPIVHQTYAELKMEDEKEDDYMYRALMNARANADTIDLSVMLLRQQIQVFGNKLNTEFDPNQVLKQHFDEYRVDISDKYYHPMKTFDSLGLYAQPTISILNNWLNSERKLTKIILNAKTEPLNKDKGEDVIAKEVIKTIQDIIDIFSRLQKNFNDIDKANANYTEAVQKKVNYLSSSDKTIKGKIDKIILTMANEIKNNLALTYEEMPTLVSARECLNINRCGFLDSASTTLPFKRTIVEDSDPLPIEDDLNADDFIEMNDKLSEDLNRFSDATILEFVNKMLAEKKVATNEEISFENQDNIVLMILSIIKANLETIPYSIDKIKERIEHEGYYMPLYEFKKLKEKK